MRLFLLIECPQDQIDLLRDIVEPTETLVVTEDRQVMLDSTDLTDELFDELDSARISSTWKKARQFISQINGAASISIHTWVPISLVNMKVARPDGERIWFPITASAEIYISPLKLTATMNTGKEAGEKNMLAVHVMHPAAKLLLISQRDAGVAKVLRLQEREGDWTNLYRILEVIQEDIGGDPAIVAKGWATKGDIEAFTASANNTAVTGDDSRHGNFKSNSPKRTMSLTKARCIITDITSGWLDYKAHQRTT